jgi:hypothetical protein
LVNDIVESVVRLQTAPTHYRRAVTNRTYVSSSF